MMTNERPEIHVERSANGIDWVAYEFKWTPGDVNLAPRWCAPHQPRLDWQMWFAALGGLRQEQWFENFVVRLLDNEPSVTCLLARNPFPDKPPKYVRAVLFKYQFTTSEEHRATGAWWKRREIGEFFWGAHAPRVLAMVPSPSRTFRSRALRRGAAICMRGRVRSPDRPAT